LRQERAPANGFEAVPAWSRLISREEAHALFDMTEQEGLVHCTYNAQGDLLFVCNCCACSCGLLRGVSEFAAPYLLVRSNQGGGAATKVGRNC
jgi:hypothetical protein